MDTTSEILHYLRDAYCESEYPALADQIERWRTLQPLKGVRVVDATPIFRNTLLKYAALLSSGAKLNVGVSSKISHDKKIIDFLRKIGVTLVSDKDDIECDVIMDCAGAFSGFQPRLGFVELTRSGEEYYKSCAKPVFLADSGRIKRIETMLGTGEGYFRAMNKLGYNDWNGKRLLVFGGGKVGRGIAHYGTAHGAVITIITDLENGSDNRCDMIDYHDITRVQKAISEAHFIVSATGVRNALAQYTTELSLCSAIIVNMGAEDEFGSNLSANRVLNNKNPLNFILDEPTLLRYIDATMALDNEGAAYIVQQSNLPQGIITPPLEIEEQLLDITQRNGLITNDLKMI